MLVNAAWTSRMFAAVCFLEHLVHGDEMDALVGVLRTWGLFVLKDWSNAREVRKMYAVLLDFVH